MAGRNAQKTIKATAKWQYDRMAGTTLHKARSESRSPNAKVHVWAKQRRNKMRSVSRHGH